MNFWRRPQLFSPRTVGSRERRTIKDHPNTDTPVIILTANAIVGAKEMYMEKGFTDYLSKPILRNDLIEMLYRYLPKSAIKNEEVLEFMPEENAVSSPDTETAASGKKTGIAGRFPFLDTKLGMSYCMDDEEFYVEMIETYLNGDKRQLIAKAFEAGNLKDYDTYTHALKSTSLNIGAAELSEHAKALEFAAKNGDTEYIRAHHHEVLKEYSVLLEHIKAALS